MTKEHFLALMRAADAKETGGWWQTPEGRQITLYAAGGGATLTVTRVEAARIDGLLMHAKTVRGEEFVFAIEDVFGGAAEGAANQTRKAGFV